MLYQRYFKLIFAVAALTGCFLSLALAGEPKQRRQSQGNNLQWDVTTGWAAPIYRGWNSSLMMFPKGSGNVIANDGWQFVPSSARDLDGDGTAEDTVILSQGRGGQGMRVGIEDAQLLADLYNQGVILANEVGKIQYVRVWSTIDEDDLADWPAGGRVGCNPSGEIIQYGAETMYTMKSAIFDGGTIQNGVYEEWIFHFLDYGESNNMVYMHTRWTNITEFMKYHHDAVFRGIGEANPDGWDWKGFLVFMNWRGISTYGGTAIIGAPDGYNNMEGWAYHPAREIIGQFCSRPQVVNFSPPEPPMFGIQVLKHPSYNGETMKLSQMIATGFGTEYGISGAIHIAVSGYTPGESYRAALGELDQMPGVISPFTGRHHNSYPGVLEPTDSRYDQWLWGGGAWVCHPCWSEVHNVAPRDTLSMDWAVFFTYPGVLPLVKPPGDVANIDNEMMQDALAPLETYAEVAQSVYEGGYILPASPQAPTLTIIPGDRQVSITWGDVNLNTPDPYYYFLQETGLDPQGRYREYDFEGFRVYRSFVGPNDSHSELLADFNLSDKNLQLYYVDKLDEDVPYKRMRNGLPIFYSVQPYDLNYDVATGDPFSLPPAESGKVWNRAEAGLYGVVPRSNASNFKPALMVSQKPVYLGPTTVASSSVELAGDGTGKLLEAPQWLQPNLSNVIFTAVNNERITSDKTIYIECSRAWHDGGGCNASMPNGARQIKMVDGSYDMVHAMELRSGGNDVQTLVFSDAATSDGISYALEVEFSDLNAPNNPGPAFWGGGFGATDVHYIDKGTFTGTVETVSRAGCGPDSRLGSSPSLSALARTGRFTVTWKASGSDMTVEVQDVTRGTTIPAVTYLDEDGWGFMTPEENGGEIAAEKSQVNGLYYDEAFKDELPKAERSAQLLDKIPSDYSEPFGLWLDYFVWKVSGGVPADGTVWTIDNAWGTWNDDKTVFTQVPDLPSEEDSWKIEVKAMTMDPEDADFTKIRVVPNPYIASSFLDNSPSDRRIEFINLPDRCTIRIYTLSGNLVNVLSHIGANRQGWGNYTDWDRLNVESEPRVFTGYDNHGGTELWNMRNRFGQTVASGLYLYHVSDQRGESHTGKFYIIN